MLFLRLATILVSDLPSQWNDNKKYYKLVNTKMEVIILTESTLIESPI